VSAELLPSGTKRGRPALDELTAIVNAFFGDHWSPRTRARYVRAWRFAEFAGIEITSLVRRCARSNGSIDVAKMLELAEGAAAMKLLERQ
jgi:hypothetical protein